MAYYVPAMIFLILNSLFLIVAYCYLFYAMRNRNKSQSEVIFVIRMQRSRNKDMYRRVEFRLFVMSSIIVGMQLLLLLFVSTKVFPWFSHASLFIYIFYNPFNVLYSGVSAYLLWLCSDALRRYVLAVLKIKK
ncbi:hypothetical protein GCK32_002606 [Trichostrongylus colubriformis]|uniref:Uncharacterized protein n=1 Tax=Trichostrongylus colubriformis TaxID=6319 RepID=A0AAN8IVS2_TRICO